MESNPVLNLMLPGDWKPVLSALIQPPASLLLIIGPALLLQRRHRAWAATVIGLCCALLWLLSCTVTAHWLQERWLRPPPALGSQQRSQLHAGPDQVPTAIVVLGAGLHKRAPEYGDRPTLTQQAMVRLRYGVWLARQTGLPLAYSGGRGWAQGDGPSEAETAAQIARDEAGITMKWLENDSRDTRENASGTVAMLRAAGVRRIVLVTHASHMPRALRAFNEAAGSDIACLPAAVAYTTQDDLEVLDWLPSAQGFQQVHALLHELIGLLAGA